MTCLGCMGSSVKLVPACPKVPRSPKLRINLVPAPKSPVHTRPEGVDGGTGGALFQTGYFLVREAAAGCFACIAASCPGSSVPSTHQTAATGAATTAGAGYIPCVSQLTWAGATSAGHHGRHQRPWAAAFPPKKPARLSLRRCVLHNDDTPVALLPDPTAPDSPETSGCVGVGAGMYLHRLGLAVATACSGCPALCQRQAWANSAVKPSCRDAAGWLCGSLIVHVVMRVSMQHPHNMLSTSIPPLCALLSM